MKSSIDTRNEKKEFALMGGKVSLVIYDTEEMAAEIAFQDFLKEARRLEKIFSFYDEKSEISELNRKRTIKASKELLEVMNLALRYCRLSDGALDISKGKAILARKKMQKEPIIGCSYKDISISGKTITLSQSDVLVDLGSVAKGWIADRLAEMLKSLGVKSAFIDARGDLLIFGDEKEIVGVAHPRKKDSHICRFHLSNNAVATSGDYKQFFGKFENSHIIGSGDFSSVSVVCESLGEADAAATSIFAMGKEKAKDFLKNNQGLKAYAVGKDMKTYYFNGFEKMILGDEKSGA